MKKVKLIEIVGQMNYVIGFFDAKSKADALRQYEETLQEQGHTLSEAKKREIIKESVIL